MSDFILLHGLKDGKEMVLRKSDISAIFETDKGTVVCRKDDLLDKTVSESPSDIYAKLNMERVFVDKEGKSKG